MIHEALWKFVVLYGVVNIHLSNSACSCSPSWLVDSKRIASKIKNATEIVDPTKFKWKSNPCKACPSCNHVIDNSDVCISSSLL